MFFGATLRSRSPITARHNFVSRQSMARPSRNSAAVGVVVFSPLCCATMHSLPGRLTIQFDRDHHYGAPHFLSIQVDAHLRMTDNVWTPGGAIGKPWPKGPSSAGVADGERLPRQSASGKLHRRRHRFPGFDMPGGRRHELPGAAGERPCGLERDDVDPLTRCPATPRRLPLTRNVAESSGEGRSGQLMTGLFDGELWA